MSPTASLSSVQLLLSKGQALREERLQRKLELEREIERSKKEAVILSRSEQLLLKMSATVLDQSTGTIDKLVTAGLKLVFDDQNLSFVTTTDKLRGKTAVRFQIVEAGRTTPVMSSYGGGVLAVTGLLIRIATILLLKQRRVLFLDETLSHVSDQYHENTSKLIRKLCEELDFTIVMVTHAPSFAGHATRHYQAQSRANATVFVEQTPKPPQPTHSEGT